MNIKKNIVICLIIVLLAGITLCCFAAENRTVILATTTSVQDTGLLDVLVDAFHKKSGYTLKAIAVGTGQALQMGRLGEADILWVHSPDDEKHFVEEGFGTDRTTFMHNDFVILGPKNDPAKVIGSLKAGEAFKKISASKNLFISRGDNSGTHKKELKIWKEAGISPVKETYIEVGQGMAATVGVANEKQAYCLADRSTYLSLKKSIDGSTSSFDKLRTSLTINPERAKRVERVDLVIVCEGDKSLLNYYSLILVNPKRFPKVNVEGAKSFFDFLLSKDTKDIVENFGKERYGAQLFFYDK